MSRSCPTFLNNVIISFRLRSHEHEYESGTVQVPVYEFRQTRVCVYFNGGRSHTYEYGLPVNFSRIRVISVQFVFLFNS